MDLAQERIDGRGVLLIDKQCCDSLALAPGHDWFNSEYWQLNSAIVGTAAGRGTTIFIRHNDHELVLRHYCRGGLIRHFSHDWFAYSKLENTRPYRELSLLSYMQKQGLPVPFGIAGFIKRTMFGYRADIITLRIPEAIDVHTTLLKRPLKVAVWRQIGYAIRRMHESQVFHHDLNISNIMLDVRDKVWLIDFDKCYRREGSDWKQTNLDRLARSLNKQSRLNAQYHFTQDNWEALMQGYAE